MGYIHSLESFGTVDGPGVRFVVFFEGCPMRCQYCHNPDTWNPKGKVKYQMTSCAMPLFTGLAELPPPVASRCFRLIF